MKKKPDNIVYNYDSQVYDAFKKEYPTSFNSKTFKPEITKSLHSSAKNYFESKFYEIKEEYERLLKDIEYSNLLYNAKCNFTPVVGKTYYLYKGKESNFISLIAPNEWDYKFLGSYKLTTNNIWNKTK